MRKIGILAAWALVCIGGPAAMAADAASDYPNRPIHIITPYAPGGGTDNLIRVVAAAASKTLGQPIIIENKPGGNTQIGVAAVLQAKPDGYTLITQGETDVLGPLMKDRNFDPLKNFNVITIEAGAPILMTVHSTVPAHSVKELVALAKSKPGQFNYASGEATSTTRIAGEVFNIETGAGLTNIPYKGNGDLIVDAVSGYIPVSFGSISTVKQYVDSGQLRALALSGPRRNPAMPNVPTFAEAGYPGMDVYTAWMILAPKGVPPEIVAKLNEHFVKAIKGDAQLRASLDRMGFDPVADSPSEANAWITKSRAKMNLIIEKAGLKLPG